MFRFSQAPATLAWERVAELRTHAPATLGGLRAADRIILSWGRYQIVYAPFDGPWNAKAKVVLLGITPGLGQADEANKLAFEMVEATGSVDWDALSLLRKQHVAFKGSMKTTLVRMLDAVRLHEHLGVSSTQTLFEPDCNLAQMASALRYPVFCGDDNYSGGPSIVRAPFLRDVLERLLANELATVPDALVIPFGPSVEAALDFLAQRGVFSADRIVRGFPHPSGASPSRPAVFARNRDDIAGQIARWFSKRQPWSSSAVPAATPASR